MTYSELAVCDILQVGAWVIQPCELGKEEWGKTARHWAACIHIFGTSNFPALSPRDRQRQSGRAPTTWSHKFEATEH